MIEDIIYDFNLTFLIGEKTINGGEVEGFFFDSSGFIYTPPIVISEVYF